MRMTQPMTRLSACLRDVLLKAQMRARAGLHTTHHSLQTTHATRPDRSPKRHPCHRNGLPAASAMAAARRGGGTKSNPTAVSHASRPLRALSNALRSPLLTPVASHTRWGPPSVPNARAVRPGSPRWLRSCNKLETRFFRTFSTLLAYILVQQACGDWLVSSRVASGSRAV